MSLYEELDVCCSQKGCIMWSTVKFKSVKGSSATSFTKGKTFLCGFCSSALSKDQSVQIFKVHHLNEELEAKYTSAIKTINSLEKEVETLASQLAEAEAASTNAATIDAKTLPGTYAKAVTNGQGYNVASLARDLKKEEVEQNKRDKNMIIAGSEPGGSEESDINIIRKIADVLDIDLSGIRVEVSRIGKVNNAGKQLLRASLTLDKKKEFLKHAKKLAQSVEFKDVYVRPDRTVAEQKFDFVLREELRQKLNQDPESTWFIRRGEVVKMVPPGAARRNDVENKNHTRHQNAETSRTRFDNNNTFRLSDNGDNNT